MTVKLVVLYTQPDDPDVFERYYAETHMPMVHNVPGLQRAEAGRFIAEADGGDPTFYRTASLYFPDRAALDQALATPEAQAVAADYEKIAPPGSRMLVQDVDALGRGQPRAATRSGVRADRSGRTTRASASASGSGG